MELDWVSLQKEAASAGLLPDGEYSVIVVEASATTSSNGKPMFKVKFRVTEGPQKDKPIWTQMVVSAESPIALRIFFTQMTALGLDSTFFAENPTADVVAKNLMNRAATVELGHREWQGSDRNEVKNIRPLQGGGPLAPGVVTGPASASPSPMSPVAATTTPTPATPASPAAPTTPASVPPPPQPF